MPQITFNQDCYVFIIENQGDPLNEKTVEEFVEKNTTVEVKFLKNETNVVDIEFADGSRAYKVSRRLFDVEVLDHEKLHIPPITEQEKLILLFALNYLNLNSYKLGSIEILSMNCLTLQNLRAKLQSLYDCIRDKTEKNDAK